MTGQDRHHLLAAQGWLELGLFPEAFAELDCITPENRNHRDALAVRWGVYNAVGKMNEAAEVAHGLMLVAPDNFEGFWMRSFALHELKRTQEAHDNLAAAMPRFEREWLGHYNLACYLTQLGRMEEARARLKWAFTLNPEHRLEALNDPDLEPLWTEIQRGAFNSGSGA